jgi:tetratricopeptide (TPR) repeat protein
VLERLRRHPGAVATGLLFLAGGAALLLAYAYHLGVPAMLAGILLGLPGLFLAWRALPSSVLAGVQLDQGPPAGQAKLRLPLVSEAQNPLELGMHPAADLLAGPDPEADLAALPPNTPSYVPRDKDVSLRASLVPGNFVLVVGDSAAGKTRSAFEAAQAVLPHYFLLNPAPNPIVFMIDVDDVPERCLIWLDDLQNYIGTIGATKIQRLLKIPGVLILATMRATDYERYAPVEPGTSPSRSQPAAAGWEELRGAVKIHFSRKFSESENARVRDHMSDPRIAEAAAHLNKYGLAEYLAAGPRLLERWRDAIDVSGHPTGAAIIAAAVDCRRTGLTHPLSEALLQDLHLDYLTAWGGARLRPESFADGLTWAITPVHATSSLLMPASDEYTSGFQAFDYLVDAVERDSAEQPIPLTVWGALLAYSDATTADNSIEDEPHERYRRIARGDVYSLRQLGDRLVSRGSTSEAVRAFEAAMALGDGDGEAAFALASIARSRGELEVAEDLYRRASGLNHMEATRSLGELAFNKQGISAAREIWTKIEDKADTWTALAIGDFLRLAGELPDALAWYERAVDSGRYSAYDRLSLVADQLGPCDLKTLITEEIALLRIIEALDSTGAVPAARRLAQIRKLQRADRQAKVWEQWADLREAYPILLRRPDRSV